MDFTTRRSGDQPISRAATRLLAGVPTANLSETDPKRRATQTGSDPNDRARSCSTGRSSIFGQGRCDPSCLRPSGPGRAVAGPAGRGPDGRGGSRAIAKGFPHAERRSRATTVFNKFSKVLKHVEPGWPRSKMATSPGLGSGRGCRAQTTVDVGHGNIASDVTGRSVRTSGR